MPTELRFDAQTISTQLRRDARGFLVVPARITRTGVFAYKRADGSTVRELRHPDDVFHPDALATLEGASVTDGHPSVSVGPGNVRALEVGIVTGVRRDGRFVEAQLSIRDAAAIAKVEKKTARELSCGYACEIVAEFGTYEGERYDQRQTRIRANHVAFGPAGWGRAGSEVRFRHDSAGAALAAAATTFYGDAPAAGAARMPTIPEQIAQNRRDAHQHQVREQTRRLDAFNASAGEGQRADSAQFIQQRLEAAQRRLHGGQL